MDKLSYAVVLDDDHRSTTRMVADELTKQGFDVRRIIASAGAIYGTADEVTAVKIRGMSGIEEVRPTSSVQLPEFREGIPQ